MALPMPAVAAGDDGDFTFETHDVSLLRDWVDVRIVFADRSSAFARVQLECDRADGPHDEGQRRHQQRDNRPSTVDRVQGSDPVDSSSGADAEGGDASSPIW